MSSKPVVLVVALASGALALPTRNMQTGGERKMVRVAMHHKTGTYFFQGIMTEWAKHHSLSLAHGRRIGYTQGGTYTCRQPCSDTADVCLQCKFHEHASNHPMPMSMFVP